MSIRRKFAINLQKIRINKNLTQEQMAERLQVTVRYYQRLESKNPPNVKIETIAKLAKELKVSASELVKGI